MIVTKLIGGLGNQMFQYAVGRSLAEIHQTSLALDTTDSQQLEARPFDLGKLNARYEIAGSKIVRVTQGNRWQRLLKRIFPGPWNLFFEKYFHFDDAVLKSPDQTYLVGFWQSEKYFAGNRTLLLKEFIPKNPLSGLNLELSTKINQTTAVSLHIRRGDYVTNLQANQFHGIMALDYYHESLKYLKSKIPPFEVFVFSDDPKWVQENLKTDYKTHYVIHNQDKNEEDMRMMSLCHHNIIANSSFSWWGAWLNQNPNKIVIAPKNWFKDLTKDTKDLIPSEWIRL